MVKNVLKNFKSRCKRTGIKPMNKLTIHTLRKSYGQNWPDYLPMNVVSLHFSLTAPILAFARKYGGKDR